LPPLAAPEARIAFFLFFARRLEREGKQISDLFLETPLVNRKGRQVFMNWRMTTQCVVFSVLVASAASGGTGFLESGVFRLDLEAPEVLSISLAEAYPPEAAEVAFQVQFSEAVSPVALDDFHLETDSEEMLRMPFLRGLTGTGSERTVFVSTGEMAGELGLQFTDIDYSVCDAFLNPVMGGAASGMLHTVVTVTHVPLLQGTGNLLLAALLAAAAMAMLAKGSIRQQEK
jgi:hypothetical protein